ncbi:DUF2971 domain-containing protein [Variovorax soli]|uniref:DUF2971 domain-containing protein n=1 Tax=Variovorax soli TaxID=376815 RepID=A0ABU1NF66_9BURK|nr:DUF2971 domain-containing protein [Variovorax soli]MDR6536983.1 hypothetical protein [Variovorax soli]
MSIYKYLPIEIALLYFENWHLRLSRRFDLNDPFEIQVKTPTPPPWTAPQPSPKLPPDDLHWLPPAPPPQMVHEYQDFKVKEALWPMVGMVCFSRTRRHLLMWAHYTNSHKGVLLEFDDKHPCFSRKIADLGDPPASVHPEAVDGWRNAVAEKRFPDLWGRLDDVQYSDERFTVYSDLEEDAVKRICLTKSLEWAYEQEVRLLWPVALADEPESSKRQFAKAWEVRLFSVPPGALRSITLGALCHSESQLEIKRRLDKTDTGHVQILRAVPDKQEFRLNYESCDWPKEAA